MLRIASVQLHGGRSICALTFRTNTQPSLSSPPYINARRGEIHRQTQNAPHTHCKRMKGALRNRVPPNAQVELILLVPSARPSGCRDRPLSGGRRDDRARLPGRGVVLVDRARLRLHVRLERAGVVLLGGELLVDGRVEQLEVAALAPGLEEVEEAPRLLLLSLLRRGLLRRGVLAANCEYGWCMVRERELARTQTRLRVAGSGSARARPGFASSPNLSPQAGCVISHRMPRTQLEGGDATHS